MGGVAGEGSGAVEAVGEAEAAVKEEFEDGVVGEEMEACLGGQGLGDLDVEVVEAEGTGRLGGVGADLQQGAGGVVEGVGGRDAGGGGLEDAGELLGGGGEAIGGGVGLGTEEAGFGGGFHVEIAVDEGEAAGEAHEAGPSGAGVLVLGTGFGEPSPEDAVAVGVELGFGGVEGSVAVVEFTGFEGVEAEGFGVEGAGVPEGFALGGVDEDVLAGGAEGEEVGALPHFAGVDGVGAWDSGPLAFEEGVEVLPLGEVGGGGAVEEDHATLASDTGADEEVLGVGDAEGGGVAEAGDVEARGWGGDDGLGVLGPGAEGGVGGEGEVLGFSVVVVAVAEGSLGEGDGLDAGVDDGRVSVEEEAAAGEASLSVGAVGGGGEGDGLAGPVDHVGTGGVGPVHVSPDGSVGVVLVEHVVLAAIVNGGAGIVHPAAGGEEMEAGAVGIVRGGAVGWGGEGLGGEAGGGGEGEGLQDGAAGKDHGTRPFMTRQCGERILEGGYAVGWLA